MKPILTTTAALLAAATLCAPSAGLLAAEGWTPLFDGESLAGWKVAEHPDAVRVQDGVIVCDGPRAHAFYVGDVHNADFKNFERKSIPSTCKSWNC